MTEGAGGGRARGAKPQRSTARLGWLLVGSFTLTVLLFVLASIVANWRARGIVSAAESITKVAFPTASCVAEARTWLRRVGDHAGRLQVANASRDLTSSLARLTTEREDLASTWDKCITLPRYPGEEAVQRQTTASMAELSGLLDRLVERAERGELKDASVELGPPTQRVIERLDDSLRAESDLVARQSSVLGAYIRRTHLIADKTLLVLSVLAVLFAITAALTMVRLFREFALLMETRISILEQFSNSLAHDIRSPLATVSLTLELLKRDPRQAERDIVLDRATQSLQRALQLVDDLLVFARAGAPPKGGAVAEVGEVVAGVLDQMRPVAEEKSVELHFERSDAASVACSPGVLISIVSNLVANAIKHMGDAASPRRVSVRMNKRGDAVRVEVSDTGPGVPAAARAHVFEPYMRLVTPDGTPGLGLGLATVRRLVEAHGGSVGLRAEDPGSTFWFELPKASAEPRALR